MGMRPIQFCLDLFPRFGGDEAKRIEGQRRSEQCLLKLLEALTDINLIWLQANLGASSIYEGVVKGRPTLRYRREVDNEVWSDVPTIFKCGYADCVPVSSLVLREDYTFVPMAELRPGDRIMGDGTWTEVTEHAITGEKELLAFGLSNGCVLRCTANHRLFRDVEGQVEEVRAEEVKIGDDLVTASSIPIAGTTGAAWPTVTAGLTDEERAWLLGVFVADGWTHDRWRASISGLDGKVKEAQKRRVEALMAKVGVPTAWAKKYISINDVDVTALFAEQGHLARNKHLNSLRFASESAVRSVLEGLAADASNRDGVFSTTSPKLALQLRVLHRMLGIRTHIAKWDEHGGLGKHPIYQITPCTKYGERRDKKFARVRSISDGGTEMCADITTDTSKFWLPESDVIVHNCEDLGCARAAELRKAALDSRAVHGPGHNCSTCSLWAKPYISYKTLPSGAFLYHCRTWRSNIDGNLPPGGANGKTPNGRPVIVPMPNGPGFIEDPSLVLGMSWIPEAAAGMHELKPDDIVNLPDRR